MNPNDPNAGHLETNVRPDLMPMSMYYRSSICNLLHPSYTLPFISYIKVKPSNKHKRTVPMVDGNVQSAQADTHTRIAVTKDDGTVVIKQVLESLDTPPQKLTAKPK